ncbi:unnamed protein product [Cylicostephanus goldi]|uniref:Apple domain-containing protein n=1 Tax=Cylicostephanus goldi TaxID=71465 RepID=A0A3P7M0S4_CYLGO|nr:unnamed protein product [Cylicostephanus goldi]
MTSNSGVFRFTSVAKHGSYMFYFYSEDQVQCLRACYEESECAVVQYDEKTSFCKLLRTGTYTAPGYVLSRGENDSSCMTEEATGDIPFQKIPQKNVTAMECTAVLDAASAKKTAGHHEKKENLHQRDGHHWPHCQHSTPEADPVGGPVPPVTEQDVWFAVTKTKNAEATSPDDIPSEFWKVCGHSGATWLLGQSDHKEEEYDL